MTSFALKIMALISMFIDHLGDAIFKQFSSLNYIGRISFPIFAFQISEGYQNTKNIKKYFFRLFVFAILSQVPYMIAMYSFSGNAFSLNIFFTLFFGLLAIFIYDKVMSLEVSKLFRYFFGFMSVLFIGYIAQSFRFDYGFWGILVIFMFYFFRDNKMLSTIAFCASCIIKFEIQMLINGYDYRYVLLCLFTMLPIIFINSYNKKQGHKIKYFLYIFYPAHLLILYLIFR